MAVAHTAYTAQTHTGPHEILHFQQKHSERLRLTETGLSGRKHLLQLSALSCLQPRQWNVLNYLTVRSDDKTSDTFERRVFK